jgi:hypothetical protein
MIRSTPTATVVPADGAILERILDAVHAARPEGLGRAAFATFHAAQAKTAWAQRHQQWHALLDRGRVLASACRYELAGMLDGKPARVCGIAAASAGANGDESHVRELVTRLSDQAERDGMDVALLFARSEVQGIGPRGFHSIPLTDLELGVTQSSRHGAPMTLVRGGEDRDLAAIVAMGRTRSGWFRFHLDRAGDFVKHVITRKRLLAGLSAPGTRELQFVIAEEGITAAAYVVISMVGPEWTLEECGDRDRSGARVGALLQALIAREPVVQRPTIRAWLPAGFVPPQVSILSVRPAREVLMVRWLGPTRGHPPPSVQAVLANGLLVVS